MAPVKSLTQPPSEPSIAYHLPPYSGEIWTIPCSNSTLRMLVTGAETNNAFAVLGSAGTFDRPIGFHYHKEAHDIFLCLKGKLNVWANDKARSLGPGDFASVPPGTIHQYQIDSAHVEFLGLIIPGGWEEFFRFIGEPWSGPLFPTHDDRNPFTTLVPKLMAATEKFDMIPVREKESFDPQPWDDSDKSLPGKCKNGGYFLKAGEGEKFIVGGMVVRPLATTKESDGKFSIFEIESSSHHTKTVPGKEFAFKDAHHAFQSVEGHMSLVIEGEKTRVAAGETVFVPAGMKFKIEAESFYSRGYLFANGGGLGEVLMRLGEKFEMVVCPETKDVKTWNEGTLKGMEKEFGGLVVS